MISHRSPGLLKITLLAGLSAACALADSIAYNVTPIQTPTGMTGITLSGINDMGQIAGAGTLSGALDVFIATTSGDTLIPLLSGSSNLSIGDINSSGQVSGAYAPSGAIKAFEADTTNGVTTFSASSQYLGYSINDSGNVSGHISTGPVIFSQSGNTTFTDPSGYTGGYAFGINNENEIAGFVLTSPGGAAVPFYTDSMGNIQIVPGISNAKAYAINNSGLVLGSAGSGTTTAWVYDGTTLTNINTGSSINFVSYGGVNDSGQVVGGGADGWIWTAPGGAVALNTLVSPDWNITAAYSISNSGLILAKGSLDGGASEYVELSPVGTPEPGTTGLMIGGCLLCALFVRRKVHQTSASCC